MTNSPVLEDKHSTGFLEGMKVKWFSPRGIYPWETGTGTSRHPNIPPRAEANPRLGHLNEKHVPKKLIEALTVQPGIFGQEPRNQLVFHGLKSCQNFSVMADLPPFEATDPTQSFNVRARFCDFG